MQSNKPGLRLSTISQIAEGILEETKKLTKSEAMPKVLANEAVIYLKTALICEEKGIEKAMEYYMGTHGEDEYKEFLAKEMEGENANEV